MKLFDNDINKEKNVKEENTEMKNDEKENERENGEMTVREKKIRENIFLKYKKLREDIEKYNHFYYNEDNPLISDREYDDLIKKLENMEKEYPELEKRKSLNLSPTEKIGGTAGEKFSKVIHSVPMLSLSNTYNISEIEDFNQRAKKIIGFDKKLEYILELKLDGLSISLIYENGLFKQAVTRGDGQIGEDVTENVKEILSVPKKLKEPISIEVRGEIILPISSFRKVNMTS